MNMAYLVVQNICMLRFCLNMRFYQIQRIQNHEILLFWTIVHDKEVLKGDFDVPTRNLNLEWMN